MMIGLHSGVHHAMQEDWYRVLIWIEGCEIASPIHGLRVTQPEEQL